MSLKITEFKKCDLTECAKLLVKFCNERAKSDTWESVYDAQVYLDEYLDNPQFIGFVAKESNNVVGVCLGHTKSWWEGIQYVIDEFYIDESTKDEGTDHLLIRFVKEYLAEDGTHSVVCNTGIRDDEFWKKNEFSDSAENKLMKCTF